jgi:poly-gamma-glutamate synthesis protein (capsule biosynthesis protein)
MRRLLSALLRVLAIVVAVSLVHLLGLWLWDPHLTVPPPSVVQLPRRDATPEERADLTIVFGGDTAPTDLTAELIERHGFEYPYSATVGLLQDADLAMVNLEASVTEAAPRFPLYKTYSYKIPPAALTAMRWAGIRAIALANNHTMDHGRRGFLDTLGHLERAGIVGVGGGRNAREARRGVVFEREGVRVGVLAYLEDSFMDALYTRSFAIGGRAGCARLEAGHLKADLARMRRSADVVVVVAHWGRNYTDVTLLQRFYGRLIVELGADAVIGHHPHIHQPVGMHRGRPIVYSLGNYAFGTEGRDLLRYGLLARLRVSIREKRLRSLELIPLVTQNDVVQFKPEPLVGPEATQMLGELARESLRFGARVTVRDGVGSIVLPSR